MTHRHTHSVSGVYKGVPIQELRIDAVLWTQDRIDHLRRSQRNPGEADLHPEWATEAVMDPWRIVTVAASDSPNNAALKLIGWSASANTLLKVWIWTEDPRNVVWMGGSAVRANGSDRNRYDEVKNEQG